MQMKFDFRNWSEPDILEDVFDREKVDHGVQRFISIWKGIHVIPRGG